MRRTASSAALGLFNRTKSRGYLISNLVRHVKRFSKSDWFPLFLALVISSGAWLPLLRPGFLSTRAGGDSPFLLIRLDQLLRNLKAGVFPVRWMPDAAYGLGYPFFNYYAALPYYLAAGLVLGGWGPISALKFTQVIGFLASSAAMYALGRRVFRHPASAILASVAYTYAPFHLVNVYVRGDSLSEFFAFVWYPLLGWALLRLRDRISTGNILFLGGAYGGLIMTHNISALVATPGVVAFTLLLLLTIRGGEPLHSRSRFALAGLTGGLLGLALSSWFWLPALLERDLVQLQGMTTGFFHFTGHFRGVDLVQDKLAFDYTMDEDRNPFSMGLMQALLTGLGVVTLAGRWTKRKRIDPLGAFPLVTFLLITLCITPFSQPLWEKVPLLPLVQFPWRFLSLQALFASILIGVIVNKASVIHVVTVAVILLLVGSALGNLHPEWMSLGEKDILPERLRTYEYLTGNIGTTIRSEYLPRWVETRPFTSAVFLNQGNKPPPMVIEGEVAEALLLDSGPIWEVWDITVTSSQAQLAFHTHYFPGWRATVAGASHSLFPVEGWGTIGLLLPQGRHEVTLRLGRTPLRWIGELISLLALIVVVIAAALDIRRSRCKRVSLRPPLQWTGLVVAVLAVGGVGLRLMSTEPASSQDLSMDFLQQPYLHHNPEGICYGESVCLLHYDILTDEVQAGELLTATLTWDAPVVRPLTATVRFVSAAKAVLDEAPLSVRSKVLLIDGRTTHQLEVPSIAAPGPYLLAVELRDEEKRLTTLTSGGKRLDTIYLRPVWIRALVRGEPLEKPIAHFGERLVLWAAQAERTDVRRLSVCLTWQPLQPIPANYSLSLRLIDPSGQQIAVRDLQPFYGLYPTSLWPPDVIVEDVLSLSFPRKTPPGDDYTLEVIMYRVSTLVPIGQARVGVLIEE